MDSDVTINTDVSLEPNKRWNGQDDSRSLGESSGTSSHDEDDDDEDVVEEEDDGNKSAITDEEELTDEAVAFFGQRKRKKPDGEAEYEVGGRARWIPTPTKSSQNTKEVGRLPIKLQNGAVQRVAGTTRIPLPPDEKEAVSIQGSETEEEIEDIESEGSDDGTQAEKMATQRGRYGRMGISEIVGTEGMTSRARLEAAKEQIAVVGAEILGGGELVDIVSGRRRAEKVA